MKTYQYHVIVSVLMFICGTIGPYEYPTMTTIFYGISTLCCLTALFFIFFKKEKTNEKERIYSY